MVFGLESLTAAAATETRVAGDCIPTWIAGAIIGPLAGAVAYQTRRIVNQTRRIEALTDAFLAHYAKDGERHEPGA